MPHYIFPGSPWKKFDPRANSQHAILRWFNRHAPKRSFRCGLSNDNKLKLALIHVQLACKWQQTLLGGVSCTRQYR